MAEPKLVPLSEAEAIEQIGVGVHTGLRKGTEAPDSGALWDAIAASKTSAWHDAVAFCVWGLEQMGIGLYKKESPDGS